MAFLCPLIAVAMAGTGELTVWGEEGREMVREREEKEKVRGMVRERRRGGWCERRGGEEAVRGMVRKERRGGGREGDGEREGEGRVR